MNDKKEIRAILSWDLDGPHELLLQEGDIAQLGREASNEVVLDVPQISRHHAVISWRDGHFEVQDLGSTNGTQLNDDAVTGQQRLQDGDHITLFDIDLSFSEIRDTAIREKPGTKQTLIVAQNAPRPRLIISAGSQEGREIRLAGGTMTIGRMTSRSKQWDIALQDRAVSRPHARLDLGDAGFMLVDLDSANGTSLNGTSVTEPTLLTDGDVLNIGETTLIFRMK